MFCCLALLLLAVLQFTNATQVNRTIDDTRGDSVTGAKPIYVPSIGGVWASANCPECAIKPNQSLAFDGTWTAATFNAQLGLIAIEFSFTGTAIYVFFILSNTVAPGITTQTECNFTLDGQAAGSFFHAPSSSVEFVYNALVFSRSNLQNTHHLLNISTSGVNHNVFINFDYAIYTIDDTHPTVVSASPTSSSPVTLSSASTSRIRSTPSSTTTTFIASSNSSMSQPGIIGTTDAFHSASQTSNAVLSNAHNHKSALVGAIIGGSVGAVVIFLFLALLFCRRRTRNTKNGKMLLSISIPFNSTSSSTARPTSEFFPARIDASDPDSQIDTQGLDHNSDYPTTAMISRNRTRVMSPMRCHDDRTIFATPLQPLRFSEASRRPVGQRLMVSDRKRDIRLHEQMRTPPQPPWHQQLDEPPPEYLLETSLNSRHSRPSLSFLRTIRR